MMKNTITLIAILFSALSSFAQMGFGMALRGDATTGIEIEKVVDKSGAQLAGMLQGDMLLSVNGKSFAGKKEYLIFENGKYVSKEEFSDGSKKPANTPAVKPNTSNTKIFKKGSEVTWTVEDDGFFGFFKIVFTAVTADSICFNWSVAEISEPLQKGSVKIGKNAIGNAVKFESEFLQDNGKKFATLQNGVIFFLSNTVAKQLMAKQNVDIQFIPEEKSKYKLTEGSLPRLSPEDGKTFITQYECADENKKMFSFINDYNIPVVTDINIKTATFTLAGIKL